MMPNWLNAFQTFCPRYSIFAWQKEAKSLIFQSFFLPLGDPLVATFNETRAPTCGRYVEEQVLMMSNWLKTFQTSLSHSSIFTLEKFLKVTICTVFLHLRVLLIANFSETAAPTSRKYVAEQGIVMSNWVKACQGFCFRSCIFALEKQFKNLNFQTFFYL